MIILFYITLFLYISTIAIQTNWVDYDFWARLIVGKTFFQTGSLLNYDFQSFGPTVRWFDHEWGSSLIFYAILDNFGEKGLFAFKIILIFLVYFIITKIILLRRKHLSKTVTETPSGAAGAKTNALSRLFNLSSFGKAPFNIIFFILLIQASITTVFPTLRCNQLTFLFFVMWFYVLEKTSLEGRYKILWILPATMVLWANIHGGCFTGLGLLFLYTAGEFLNKKPVKPYIIAFFASLCAMFINPYGIDYTRFLFFAITMKRPNITEWQPLYSKIHTLSFIKYKLWSTAIALISLSYVIKKYRKFQLDSAHERLKNFYNNLDKTKALVLIAMFLLVLKTARLMPFFAFSAAIFLYDDIYEKIFSKKLPNLINNLKEGLLFFLVLMSFIYTYKNLGVFSTIKSYPYVEAEFLKINNLKGNLFANFHYGSYLAYKLHPDVYIFMDGRYEETYKPELFNTLKSVYEGKDADIKRTFDSMHIDFIIMEKDETNLFNWLMKSDDWNLAVLSNHFGLFLNKNIKLKAQKTPSSDLNYYNRHKWDTKIDWGRPWKNR